VHLDGNRLVFVAGLHRSGTTPLARCLAGHPQVSGFSGTPATEDEGQHLQDVYPPARRYGGTGRFALDPRAHLTEDSPLATEENARRLFAQWRPYWDLSKPVLVEKSPPNLVMTRFLQALYPDASFVVVVRHPVVVCLSSRKWTRGRSLDALLRNWFAAHDIFSADAPHLARVHLVLYENLVTRSDHTLAGIRDFLGLDGDIPAGTLQGGRSSSYEASWESLASSRSPLRRRTHRRLCERYEERAAGYGYSLHDLGVSRSFALPR